MCGERYLERWWGGWGLMRVSGGDKRERKRREGQGWEGGEMKKRLLDSQLGMSG